MLVLTGINYANNETRRPKDLLKNLKEILQRERLAQT